jgi:SAM-dependent methyltransferase
LLDRLERPAALLDEIARVLAPQGLLVLTSPLNWRSRNGDEWSRMGTVKALQDELRSRGLTIEKAFDGLVYREILDVRRSSTDWEVAVVTARAGG